MVNRDATAFYGWIAAELGKVCAESRQDRRQSALPLPNNPTCAGSRGLVQANGKTWSRVSGAYNSSTGAFTSGSGIANIRDIVVHGSASSSGADSVSSWDGHSFPATYLIPNQSMMDTVIYSAGGIALRTEQWVYTGSGAFSLMTYENVTWNDQGRVTQRLANNGATFDTHYGAGGLPDEVRPLVESFNRLLGRLDETIQGERRFIADAAHELRTPLAALLAQTQVALRSAVTDEEKTSLRRLVAGVERSARLSEQLLDMARLDADKYANGHGRIDLYDLLVVVIRDFETAANQKRQLISLDTEPCVIVGHVDELGILIRNLMDNALRYAGEGGHVAVSCKCLQDSKGRVCLRVADDGPGVPESERGRIFDRFYRVPGNGERGSGIGLSLVARIAQLHGATIEVGEGLDGRGFGIDVRFPAPPPEVA